MTGEQLLNATQDLIHVWQVKLSEITDAFLLQRYAAIISPEEQVRRQRFAFAKDRHRDLVTRALVRTTLSRFSTTNPQDWRFVDNGYGRPSLDPRHACAGSLRFNVAHSGDWLVMAVGHNIEIGVDIEACDAKAPLDLANHYFAKCEALALSRLAGKEQHCRFFELWTLKESYMKARGLGLSLALDSFAFDLSKPGLAALAYAPACDRNPKDWRFMLTRADDNHPLSLCFRAEAGRSVKVLWRKSIPLRSETSIAPVILRRSPSLAR